MTQDQLQGIRTEDELSRQSVIRDVRSLPRWIAASVNNPPAMAAFSVSLAVLLFLIPALHIVWFVLGVILFVARFVSQRKETLPFRLPAVMKITDYADPKPGHGGFNKARGMIYIGNEKGTNKELWISISDVLTHMKCLGSTGSGKSFTMTGTAFCYLCMGTGYSYTDPKAAPILGMKHNYMVRLFGRDDDLRILNFNVSDKKVQRSPVRISNDTNVFAIGSADTLSQLLVSIMPKSEGTNAIFGQKAQTLINGLMLGLTELRDRGEINLYVKTIRDYALSLQKYVELATREDLSPDARDALQAFLRAVNWDPQIGADPSAPPYKVMSEQFSYASSYFGQALSMLTDTYSHIYRVPIGEVDPYDVVANRRIQITLFPTLSKSEQEIENLGKVGLTSMRSACSVGLGTRIEGTYAEVVDSLPTAADRPFGNLIDELVAILVGGFGDQLTMGRGLGVATTVGNQDWGSLVIKDQKSAKQISGNTKLTMAMTLDDPEDTWKFIQALGAQANVVLSEGYHVDKDAGPTAGYSDKMSSAARVLDRVDIRDLQAQVEGEFHGFFRGRLVRGDSFAVKIPDEIAEKTELRIVRMLKIVPPDAAILALSHGAKPEIMDAMEEYLRKPDDAPNATMLPEARAVHEKFASGVGTFMDRATQALVAWRETVFGPFAAQVAEAEAGTGTEPYSGVGDWPAENAPPVPPPLTGANRNLFDGLVEDDEEDGEGGDENGDQGGGEVDESLIPDEETQAEQRAYLQTIRRQVPRSDVTFSPEEDAQFLADLIEYEENMGHTPEVARDRAAKLAAQVARGMAYPVPPTPEKSDAKTEQLNRDMRTILDKAEQKLRGQ